MKKLRLLGKRSQVNSELFVKSRLEEEDITEVELPIEEQSGREGRRVRGSYLGRQHLSEL